MARISEFCQNIIISTYFHSQKEKYDSICQLSNANLKSFGRHQNYAKRFVLSYLELEGNMILDLDTRVIVLYERKSHDFSKKKSIIGYSNRSIAADELLLFILSKHMIKCI